MDRVRGQQMPKAGPTLDYIGIYTLPVLMLSYILINMADEAFTSENWIVGVMVADRLDRFTHAWLVGPYLPSQEGRLAGT